MIFKFFGVVLLAAAVLPPGVLPVVTPHPLDVLERSSACLEDLIAHAPQHVTTASSLPLAGSGPQVYSVVLAVRAAAVRPSTTPGTANSTAASVLSVRATVSLSSAAWLLTHSRSFFAFASAFFMPVAGGSVVVQVVLPGDSPCWEQADPDAASLGAGTGSAPAAAADNEADVLLFPIMQSAVIPFASAVAASLSTAPHPVGGNAGGGLGTVLTARLALRDRNVASSPVLRVACVHTESLHVVLPANVASSNSTASDNATQTDVGGAGPDAGEKVGVEEVTADADADVQVDAPLFNADLLAALVTSASGDPGADPSMLGACVSSDGSVVEIATLGRVCDFLSALTCILLFGSVGPALWRACSNAIGKWNSIHSDKLRRSHLEDLGETFAQLPGCATEVTGLRRQGLLLVLVIYCEITMVLFFIAMAFYSRGEATMGGAVLGVVFALVVLFGILCIARRAAAALLLQRYSGVSSSQQEQQRRQKRQQQRQQQEQQGQQEQVQQRRHEPSCLSTLAPWIVRWLSPVVIDAVDRRVLHMSLPKPFWFLALLPLALPLWMTFFVVIGLIVNPSGALVTLIFLSVLCGYSTVLILSASSHMNVTMLLQENLGWVDLAAGSGALDDAWARYAGYQLAQLTRRLATSTAPVYWPSTVFPEPVRHLIDELPSLLEEMRNDPAAHDVGHVARTAATEYAALVEDRTIANDGASTHGSAIDSVLLEDHASGMMG
jgi:hypothetical protein